MRSLRLLFASNLVLAFSIPIATIAVQERKVFLVNSFSVPVFSYSVTIYNPSQSVFWAWLVGIVLFVIAVVRALLWRRSAERHATRYLKEACNKLSAGDVFGSVQDLSSAVTYQLKLTHETVFARWLFVVTLLLFVVCIGVEFAMFLFASGV